MNYLLVDGSESIWTLGKVTARREKALTELGIAREKFGAAERSVDEIVKEILDECDEKLIKLIGILFEGRAVEKDELENVDKIEVQKGIMGFFLADLELMNGYNDLLGTLSSLKSPEKNPQP
ncbi:MAG: hypothetical protein GY804_09800 [Alphaproteobacteria bacterium]|nr:hypothetical protein [Alphaproteobacteria bacterium]